MNEYQREVMEGFVEIEPLNSDQFLKLKETLTRIGIPSRSEDPNELPTLWQSVHVFHNRGRYYLVHFKHMFLLDGRVKSTKLTDTDLDRLEAVAALVEKWAWRGASKKCLRRASMFALSRMPKRQTGICGQNTR